MKKYLVYVGIIVGLMLILVFVIRSHRVRKEEYTYELRREKMVADQIAARGVKDEKVLWTMGTVPRHKFVSENLINSAYEDRPLPIGCGQTISQPYIVALMTELLNLSEKDKVLEVGTGSGYQAAVLSGIVKEVYTIEIFEELGTSAGKRLKDLGYQNVKVKVADGYYGWPGEAPFDAIIVTCAATHIPPPLIEQLKDGGTMCIPVGSVFWTQNLMLVQKRDGKIIAKSVLPVRFVPLLGKH